MLESVIFIHSFIHVTLRGIQFHVKLVLFAYMMRFLLRCTIHYLIKRYFPQSCIRFSADSAEQTVLCVVKKGAGIVMYRCCVLVREAPTAACGLGSCS